MPVGDSHYLDPDILRQLPNMELLARRLVEGLFVGYHKSPFFGYSVEFVDHREYVRGDDVRNIDWRVWARKNKYYIKRFEMESQLKAQIILDTSKSMDYGEGRLTKLQYASYLAASLVYMVIHQNDMAGLVTFDGEIKTYLPPRGSRSHMRAILKVLENVQPGPATNVPQVCHHLAETMKARSMVILISDLLDDEEEIINALRHFQHRKHDVVVFHVLDDSELDLPFEELSNFRDLESGRRVAVDPATFRGEYRNRVSEFCESLKSGCRQTDIDYMLLRSSAPIETALTEYLHFRARRSR
ncbi:MAG: DUF58 domain-containing protein [Planctomycetota bacterium]|nr:DUF58 domain-containing protein [Planctomycetota bacterium]